MRKTRLLMWIAAAALTLAACSNDEDDNWNGEIRLSSGLTAQGTRAGTDIHSSQFDSGETIDVYIAENTIAGQTATTTYGTNGKVSYTANGSGDLSTTNTQYYPTSGNGVNIYAIYPSGTVTGATFSVQTDQSDDTKYKASDLMYGVPASNPVNRTSSPVNIGFKHLLSKITITLKAGDGITSLDGAKVEILNVLPSTTLTASATGGSVSSASGTATDITVFTSSTSSTSGSCIVPPQTLNQTNSENVRRFIKVTLKDGGELYSGEIKDSGSNVQNDITMTGGYEYKYDITANNTALSITSSIVAWATGGSGNGIATMENGL